MRAPDVRAWEGQVRKSSVKVRRQRQTLLRRHWLTGALVFLACGVCLYAGFLFYEVESKLVELQHEKQALEIEAENLRAKNSDIREDVARLNDPQYVEQMAKQLLGMAYPGETVVRAGKGAGAGR